MLLLVSVLGNVAYAQIQIGDDLSDVDYLHPKEYEIGGITVEGAKYVDASMLSMIAGLRVGQTVKIPSDDIASAIRKIWEQGMFEDVVINAADFLGDKVFLQIVIKEKPRVAKFSLKGVKKSEADEIRNKINLSRGDVATNHLVTKTKRIIEDYFYGKGFLNVDVDIQQVADTVRDSYVDMIINIDKGKKVKIGEINFIGNDNLSDGQLLASMKETKQRGHFDPLDPLGPLVVNTVANVVTLKPLKAITGIEEYFYDNYRPRIFKSSRFKENDYRDDKQNIIDKYNSKGYRDASIVRDSVYRIDDRNLGIDIVIDEGDKYYYRDITWTGNTKYSAETLNGILGIKKGDVYNKELLDKNLNYSENTLDISSLYMDDGYLFFHVTPVEVRVENDSIDLELRMSEGNQARIKNVTLSGNTKTYDYVVLRELYTRPGQLFSRSDVIRSVRELATLGFFNQETINPDVQPNLSDNSVDIDYSVEEAAADQISFSGGYSSGYVILQASVSFSNFSMRNVFKKDAWKPIPAGDGQKLSLSLSTYGTSYIQYGISFTEPWLGGRKPNSLTLSFYQSFLSNWKEKTDDDYGWFRRTGFSAGLSRRLTWPDDYFSIYQGFNVMRYNLSNYSSAYLSVGDGNGKFNIFSYNVVLSRNSVSQPIYPRNGSEFQIGLELTPPYSLLSNKDYSSLSENEKYKWVEMHRWSFKATWYTELYDKLVMMTRVRFGYLGHYNSEIGATPFHRYFLGGDGLNNYALDSREVIGMRGYANNSLTPGFYSSSTGGDIFTKYTLEMRYPLSLNPQATIYALTFLEAGNCWLGFKNFDPFDVKRSAGVGVRIYLPMFGLLGLDWGYGFDDVYGTTGNNGSQFHFPIGGSID